MSKIEQKQIIKNSINFTINLLKDFCSETKASKNLIDNRIQIVKTTTNLVVSTTTTLSSLSKNSIGEYISDYTAKSSISVVINNSGLLIFLKKESAGNWVKIYEAGFQYGNKIEVHYFKNIDNGKVFDGKIKYFKWHQPEFKNL